MRSFLARCLSVRFILFCVCLSFANNSLAQIGSEEFLLELYKNDQFDEVVIKADSILKTKPDNRARLYQIKADALYFLNDVPLSLENYLLAIEYSDKFPLDTVHMLESYSHAGFCYIYLGKFIEALPYYEKALNITEMSNDSSEMAIQLSHLGTIYSNLNQFNKATKFIRRAYEINFSLKDSVALAYDLVDLGDLKMRSGDYLEAINNYKQGLLVQQTKAENHNTGALRLGKVANAYLKVNELDSAKKFIVQAIIEAQNLNDSLTLAKQWVVKSRILNALKKYDSAYYYGKSASEYFEKYAGTQYIILANFELVEAYIGRQQYLKAEYLLQSIIELANEENRLEHLSEAYEKQAQLNERLGNNKAALLAYKSYQIAMDSLQDRKKQQAILILDKEYQSKQKEQEIDLLKTKDEVSQLQLAQEKRNFIALFILLGIVIIVGVYVYFTLRKKHQLQSELLTAQINELRTQIKVVLESDPSQLKLNVDGINQSLNTPLSEREFEILNFALSDLSNSEIADKAFVSVNTVKFHLKNVYEKLGVGNRKEALQFAIQSSKINS